MGLEGLRMEIHGTVQGVGFRPWVYTTALEEGVSGRVWNNGEGVFIEAFGPGERLRAFVERLRSSAPPPAFVQDLELRAMAYEAVERFEIVSSVLSAARRVSIPPDLATCGDCLREVLAPEDRRFRYPFANCTRCGPRFTIVRDLPYDRPLTTMASFRMCAACQEEYDSPEDRRFHAQPNACPGCGPTLELVDASGAPVHCQDPLEAVALALREGKIVAIKGLGGFHLACDAASAEAVGELRCRKRRPAKPFATMVESLEHAGRIAVLSREECRLLTSPRAPIVLVRRRTGSRLAKNLAPGNPLVGIFLPYTPLHHLLLRLVRRPLVMTSGNLSRRPICRANGEALTELQGIADLFLLHDRKIETRCDDSVLRVMAGRPVVFRRARGFVPSPIELPFRLERPILACGAQMKNAFCVGVGELAYLGPHVGDLDDMATLESYEEAVGHLEHLLGVKPDLIAHDLHPGYTSTRVARERPGRKIAIQHHHAHVASCMAEHGLQGPVIGVAFDGTGHGTDGTAWGGEFLWADYGSFTRVATFRPIPLPGGDVAIRQPWRIAAALLYEAFGAQLSWVKYSLFRQVDPAQLKFVGRMLERRFQTPLVRGVGRLFDGVAALCLARPLASFEGELALAWNFVADVSEEASYPLAPDREMDPWVLDYRPMIRAVVEDLDGGESAEKISAKFHNALIAAIVGVIRSMVARKGARPIVLTGGCFQNELLVERVSQALGSAHEVFFPEQIPPGDGGLALGQLAVAHAVIQESGN